MCGEGGRKRPRVVDVTAAVSPWNAVVWGMNAGTAAGIRTPSWDSEQDGWGIFPWPLPAQSRPCLGMGSSNVEPTSTFLETGTILPGEAG